ncbi:MAG: hypothetical protein AB7N76_04010 [Planctomycetota bacterium]
MTRVRFSSDDVSGLDPLTGADLGHPGVAVRVGAALAMALVLARVGNLLLWGGQININDWGLNLRVFLASSLPLGAALSVMAWRDRPGRGLAPRAVEALLLALLVHVVTSTWLYWYLYVPRTKGGVPPLWFFLFADFETQLPSLAGTSIGLALAARQRGRLAMGLAYALPSCVCEGLAQLTWWPKLFSPGPELSYCVLAAVIAPLADRLALRAARVAVPPAT